MYQWVEYANGVISMREKSKKLPSHDARFRMSYEGSGYTCEECGYDKFKRATLIGARCAECGVAYIVEYSKLDIDVIYYEG